MLHVATCLWDANASTFENSKCFNESWVEKLYRGFARNLTIPFRFVCFSERKRAFAEPAIDQVLFNRDPPNYGSFIEPFRLGQPTIIAGLDTIIVRNIDHLADYCFTGHNVALPRDPYQPERSINAIALVPGGLRTIYDDWRGENDMDWLRTQHWKPIDDLWPGQVVSLKAHKVRDLGVQRARVVYFHGVPKPQDLGHLDWVRENWC